MKRNKQILNSDHPEFSTLPSYFFIQHKKTAARQIQRWASLYLFRNSLFLEGESTFHFVPCNKDFFRNTLYTTLWF